MRIMAIDAGEKRAGIAVSDETCKISAYQKVLCCKDNFFNEILELVNEFNIRKIIVGFPVNLKSKLTGSTLKAIEFKKKLKNFLVESNKSIPVVFVDERLTTKFAEKLMLSADLSRKKRKQKIDGVAASLILESYLEYLNKNQPPSDTVKYLLKVDKDNINFINFIVEGMEGRASLTTLPGKGMVKLSVSPHFEKEIVNLLLESNECNEIVKLADDGVK